MAEDDASSDYEPEVAPYAEATLSLIDLGSGKVAATLPMAGQAAWVRAQYDDADGTAWTELDVRQLVQHEQFLNPGHTV